MSVTTGHLSTTHWDSFQLRLGQMSGVALLCRQWIFVGISVKKSSEFHLFKIQNMFQTKFVCQIKDLFSVPLFSGGGDGGSGAYFHVFS